MDYLKANMFASFAGVFSPKPKPPDAFWELMDELYKAHSDLKECAKYEPSALELCAEIERLVLDLQEAI